MNAAGVAGHEGGRQGRSMVGVGCFSSEEEGEEPREGQAQ